MDGSVSPCLGGEFLPIGSPVIARTEGIPSEVRVGSERKSEPPHVDFYREATRLVLQFRLVPDYVQRAALDLLVNAPDVLTEDANADELDSAEECHQEGE